MSETCAQLTAYCGLYCGDCIHYQSRAADLARELLNELQATGFDKYADIKSSSTKQLDAVKQLEHHRECCEVLEAIAALQCNTPCRVGGGYPTFSCEILECCKRKAIEGCWQCGEFEGCMRLESLQSIHGDSHQQNLKKIKELGLDRWAKHRCRPYIWQK